MGLDEFRQNRDRLGQKSTTERGWSRARITKSPWELNRLLCCDRHHPQASNLVSRRGSRRSKTSFPNVIPGAATCCHADDVESSPASWPNRLLHLLTRHLIDSGITPAHR